MPLNNLPISTSLRRSVSEADIPTIFADIRENVRTDVNNYIECDSILSDVFIPTGKGAFRVNEASTILSGHFQGMPIVPGVVSKRLAGKFLQSDLYAVEELPDGRKLRWKTEFIGAMTTAVDDAEFVLENEKYSLKSKGKILATFELAEHTEPKYNRLNLSATNMKDVHFNSASSISVQDPGNFVLQSPPFRFVTTGGELRDFQENQRPTLLWGYFHVPEDFIFVDEYWNVPVEIIEESVAQIASMAYVRSRNLPLIRENGELNPKAQILTFKSSLSERGKGMLIYGDQLTVAIEVLKEEGRTITFAYEAWNCGHVVVLSGIIEGTAVPLKLLKRMSL